MSYVYAIVHKPFLEVLNNCRLDNLLEKNHIFNSALFDIVALPVIWLDHTYT